MKPSARADRAWQRLIQIFGEAMQARHPDGIPADWAQVIDRVDDSTVREGLATIKTFRKPPTFAQFQAAMSSTPAAPPAPNPMPAMVAYVIANYRLSGHQLRSQWTWLYGGDSRPGSQNFGIVGVRIPSDADEGKPELTVHMSEMTGV